MKRRAALALLLALGAALTVGTALAQARIPLLAVLVHGTENLNRSRVEALRDGLRELGYREGTGYRMEVRWTDNRIERLPQLARELLQLKPNIAFLAA